MNYRQIKLYRAQWAKARDALRRQGRATKPETEEYERMLIHEQVTGQRCSSKDLNQTELDEVLAAFYVISAQLDRLEDVKAQPETRCRFIVDDICDRIVSHFIALDRPNEAASLEAGPARDGHILYLARRFAKKPLHGGLAEIDHRIWYKLIAAYRYRYDQVLRKNLQPGKGAKRRRPFDAAQPTGDRGTTKRQPRNVHAN